VVNNAIRKGFGTYEVGDLIFWERQPTTIIVKRKSGSRPFSKELLSDSIQASGLAPDQSYEIARTIEARLIDQRRQHIAHWELEDLAAELIEKSFDKSFAERYRLWRAWGDVDKPLIILIGGASGVGKTTLAIALANLLDIPRVVATDDLRQVMRLTLAQELVPALHTSSYTAWKAVPATGHLDVVVAGFREQARSVCVGVKAIISRCIEENTSVIIDGVHLIIDMLDLDGYAGDAFITPVCLELPGRDAFEDRFAQRASEAPSRSAHRYMEHLEDILKIQDYLIETSAAYGIPVITTTSVEGLTSEVAMVVSEQLQEQEEIRKALRAARKKRAVN
ncbi:MAG: hypothetical protein OXE49_07970, partial [Gemmatimonadetes bacterium]|nr:hypothetical protein [Gemmatimonadota bacterium]